MLCNIVSDQSEKRPVIKRQGLRGTAKDTISDLNLLALSLLFSDAASFTDLSGQNSIKMTKL